MRLIETQLPGVVIVEPQVFGDSRGFFMETWNERSFADLGISARFVQDNHSRSLQGILRGLHYQVRHPQGKLVRVAAGEVYDVAVDLRHDSPTFGRWEGIVLSGDNRRMLWIPPGFAHGFYVLSDSADFLYKCTDFYAPDHERTIRWDDPDLAIDWPLIEGKAPKVSEKDAGGAYLRDAEVFL